MGEVRKSCDTCRFWIPMGGCGYRDCMPCDKWECSPSYRFNNEPTLL